MDLNVNPITADQLLTTFRSTANEIEREIARWKRLADMTAGLDATEMTSMGLTTEQQNLITAFRGGLIDLDAAYENQTVPSSNIAWIVRQFADMVVF